MPIKQDILDKHIEESAQATHAYKAMPEKMLKKLGAEGVCDLAEAINDNSTIVTATCIADAHKDMPEFAAYPDWQQRELADRAANLAASQEHGSQR